MVSKGMGSQKPKGLGATMAHQLKVERSKPCGRVFFFNSGNGLRGSHWFRLFMKGRGVELPWAGTPREVAFSRGWNSQEGLLISQIQAPSSQIQLSKRVCPEVSQKRLIPRSISVKN